MKTLFTTSLLMFALSMSGIAATISISVVSGPAFSPSSTTAQVGDVLSFTLASPHTATQISQSDWNSNIGTNPIGFNLSGNGTFTYTITAGDVGTIYYICQPHASLGMKGQVTVTTTPVMKPVAMAELSAFPNPTTGNVTLDNSDAAQVKVYNHSGTVVKELYIEANGVVDLSDLTNGVYFITAISSNGRESRARIVKK